MTLATSGGMTGGIQMLEPAIGYALAAAAAITPELLPRPTPCRGWDLRMLLRHASESVAVICEGIDAGCIGLYPAGEDADVASDPARAFCDRAGRLPPVSVPPEAGPSDRLAAFLGRSPHAGPRAYLQGS